MKKLLAVAGVFICSLGAGWAGAHFPPLRVTEIDGDPIVKGVHRLRLPNGSLSGSGGVATLDPSGATWAVGALRIGSAGSGGLIEAIGSGDLVFKSGGGGTPVRFRFGTSSSLPALEACQPFLCIRKADNSNFAGIKAGFLSTNVVSTSSNYTVGDIEGVILVDASGGPRTITLPAIDEFAGRAVTVKKIDSSANTVTVVPGDGTIDGASSYALGSQYKFVTVVSDTFNWPIVGNN
ncbi:MAG TPA: hypothetical protein VFQ92_12555 [Blastocatellia bacterium]|nr:hypothetical protein [Blastocatellia bacterium]